MVARSDDADGLSVRPAVILWAAKEVELAHGHGQIGFFREAADDAMEDGALDVSVDLHPAGSSEDPLHGILGAKDQEIHHVAGVALFVADAARDLREERIIDSGKRTDLLSDDARGAPFGRVNFDAHGIGAVAGVVGSLIDADGKPARDRRKNIAAGANDKRLCGVFITDKPDERAAPGFIEGQNAEKVLETAREAVRAVVVLGVGVTQLAGSGDEHVFASLNVDAGVDPGFFAGQLNFLGEALFTLGRLRGSRIRRVLLRRDLLLRRRGVLADELRVHGMWASGGDE